MFWRYNRPAILWAIVILILCGIPGTDLPELTFLQWLRPDKIVHLVLFGVQCYLLLKGFNRQNTSSYLNKHSTVLAISISILYGCVVEILQDTIFIHRSGDVRDAAANAIGAFMGLWVYRRSNK